MGLQLYFDVYLLQSTSLVDFQKSSPKRLGPRTECTSGTIQWKRYQGIRPSGLPGGVPEPGHGGPPVLFPFHKQSLCTVLLVSEPFHHACTASRMEMPLMRIWFHHMVVLLPVPPSDTGSAASTGFLHTTTRRMITSNGYVE